MQQTQISLSDSKHKDTRLYWISKLESYVGSTLFPYDQDPSSPRNYVRSIYTFELPDEHSKLLLRVSKESDLSLFIFHCTIIKYLLFRYTGRSNTALFTSPVNSDEKDQSEEVILFDKIEQQDSFKELLVRVRQTVIEAMEHCDCTIDSIFQWLDMDVYKQVYCPYGLASFSANLHKIDQQKDSLFDLQFIVRRVEKKVFLEIRFNSIVYSELTIANLVRLYCYSVEKCTEHSSIPISDLPFISEEEVLDVLKETLPTKVMHPFDSTLSELFVKQTNATPDLVALVFENQSWTYRELLQQASQLAVYLREQGIHAEKCVGIIMDRGADVVISILAVMLSGGAYVPIDPDYPDERINFILKDSDACMVLSHRKFFDKIGSLPKVFLDEFTFLEEEKPIQLTGAAHHLAYVMYTSGSSGKPKGVLVEHRNVVNTVRWFGREYLSHDVTNVLLMANHVFDPSVEQIFGTLLFGGTLHCISKNTLLNKRVFLDYVKRKKIHMINFTPSTMRELFMGHSRIETLKIVICGGEPLDEKLKQEVLLLGYRLFNHYGPTEATIDALSNECTLEEPAYLGKPIDNTRVYVVDANMRLQPLGAVGELCIAGEGVARDYLNLPETSAASFVSDPFYSTQRMYRTGDKVRWLGDGRIEYLGRMDNQIKIHGIRIELSEIQKVLTQLDDVKEAIVVEQQDNIGEKMICGYLTLENDSKSTSSIQIKKQLSQLLPWHMVPKHLYILDKIPLMASGKVHYAQLPVHSESYYKQHEAPCSETEKQLVELWQEILGEQQIGLLDNFFELGGHSLRATQLIAKIYERFHIEFPLSAVFENPTLQALAEELSKLSVSEYNKIPKQDKRPFYPATSTQKRLFFLHQMEGMKLVYNRPVAFLVKGYVEYSKLSLVLQNLVNLHESLRTSFKLQGHEVIQIIEDQLNFKLEYEERIGEEPRTIVNSFVKSFDLEHAPLFRCRLTLLEERQYLLLFDMHHIIADGISTNILLQDFVQLFMGEELEASTINFRDYTLYLEEGSKHEAEMEDFWLSHYDGYTTTVSLPTDFPRTNLQSTRGSSLLFELDKHLTRRIKRFVYQQESTLYMLFLTVIKILISKYAGHPEVIIGTPIAGRTHPEVEKLVGMFANTIALRHFVFEEKSFISLLNEVKTNALQAFEYQEYPFEKIIGKLNPERDLSRNPIFDVMFALHNTEGTTDLFEPCASINRSVPELVFEPIETEMDATYFDLFWEAYELEHSIHFRLNYSTELFQEETIKQFTKHFHNILTLVLEQPELAISEISLLSVREEQLTLAEYSTSKSYELPYSTIYEWFYSSCSQNWSKTALVHGETKLTYKELDEKSNQLAAKLRKRGINRETVVGLLFNRSIELVVSLIAVIKTGATCLPLNPDDPSERIQSILLDSNSNLMITTTEVFRGKHVEFPGEILLYDQVKESFCTESSTLVNPCCGSADRLYIIYTSGSTGKPKGVSILHGNLVNLVNDQNIDGKLDFSGKVLQFSNFTFDVAFQELFSTLLNGGELHLAPEQLRSDFVHLLHHVKEHSIDTLFLPTALVKYSSWQKLNKELYKSIRQIIVAGEQLVMTDGIRYLIEDCGLKIHNHYGPSETHVAVTFEVNASSLRNIQIPIGKPITNTRIYIMNSTQKLLPPGFIGELCIAGAAVGSGYIGLKEETNKKFLQDPFHTGDKMYRTGDLARWLPDGNLEYWGRVDQQLKIRGYRIEPSEIEYQLMQHTGIQEAVVIDIEDITGLKKLVAFYTSKNRFEPMELKQYLFDKLPAYMVPEQFHLLSKIPLTMNNKTDKSRLRNMVREDSRPILNPILPESLRENEILDIWKSILGKNELDMRAHFFNEGGNSLKAMMLLTEINFHFGTVVPLQTLFQKPVLKEFVAEVLDLKPAPASSIEPIFEIAEGTESFYATYSQSRLAILKILIGESLAYNLPAAFYLYGNLDREKLEQCFKILISQHEALRTSFFFKEGQVWQTINHTVQFAMEYEEKLDNCDVLAEINDFVRDFPLEKAPLFRVKILRLDEAKYALLWDMHHIISDGISQQILLAQLAKIYSGETIQPQMPLMHKYVNRQLAAQTGEAWIRQEKYWLSRLNQQIPVLNLPNDYPRPQIRNYAGDQMVFQMDQATYFELNRVATDMRSTPFMFLLAAYYILLSRYSGQEHIIVGTVVANRNYPNTDQAVGNFVNTLALLHSPHGHKSVYEFIQEVTAGTIEALEHLEYPFEKLVEKLNLPRSQDRHPLFDTMFMMQNMDRAPLEMKGMEIKPCTVPYALSRFDLSINCVEAVEGLMIEIEYSTELFESETILQFGNHYLQLIRQMLNHMDANLNSLDMFTPFERNMLLNNPPVFHNKQSETIIDIFDRKADHFADCPALREGERVCTYGELRKSSERVAVNLMEYGIEKGTLVGIIGMRNSDLWIAMMGVLKAGAAFLLIDSETPVQRMVDLLKNSEIMLLINTTSDNSNDLQGAYQIVALHDLLIETSHPFRYLEIDPDSLVYVNYTSGSTGKPKGVMVEHNALLSFFNSFTERIGFESGRRIVALTSVTFDIFLVEALLPLLSGMEIIIANKQAEKDPTILSTLLRHYPIDLLQLTPSRLALLLKDDGIYESLASVKELIVGGEAFPVALYERVKNVTSAAIYNVYGPTEATVWCSSNLMTNSDEITIGKPLSNSGFRILDSYGSSVPIGVPGELYITGHGLARGYMDLEEMTSEKFLPDIIDSSCRMYRTGDIAKWTRSGEVMVLGRADRQVKIRGYRIEPGEIEAYILSCEHIVECAVVQSALYKDELLAFYVSDPKKQNSSLPVFLADRLPSYMMPNRYIELGEMPLTANGKINYKQLAILDIKAEKDAPKHEPETELQRRLLMIWSRVLQDSNLGVRDQIFENGATSMKVIEAHAQIVREVSDRLTIADVFAFPTVHAMAERLQTQQLQNDLSELFTLDMPTEYWERTSSGKWAILQIRLSDTLADAIFSYAVQLQVKATDILKAVLAYTLHEITTDTKISFYRLFPDKEMAFWKVQVDFDVQESIEQLIHFIASQKEEEAECVICTPTLKVKQERKASLLYSDNSLRVYDHSLSLFDMYIKVAIESQQTIIYCEYDSSRLVERKVKEFLQMWFNFLEALHLNPVANNSEEDKI